MGADFSAPREIARSGGYASTRASHSVPIGLASPQVTLRVYEYVLEGEAHWGCGAMADIAAKSMSCAPNVHPKSVGDEWDALEACRYCTAMNVPRVGFEPTLDGV
jgi:hypothetical protein